MSTRLPVMGLLLCCAAPRIDCVGAGGLASEAWAAVFDSLVMFDSVANFDGCVKNGKV
ncbi:hypothetical protein GCM10022206_26590 [Streptomyces chiangmaiensis]